MEDLFTKAPIPKSYFTLALPVLLSMAISMIYNLIDTYFIAQTHQTALVAGVAVCTPLFSLMLAVGDIFGIGGSALISKLLGAHQHEKVAITSEFCLYAAFFTGLLVTLLLLIFEPWALTLLGAVGAARSHAQAFYRIMAGGASLIIVSLVLSNLIRTEGFANLGMIGSIVGTIVTILLDPILIFNYRLGAAGAAWATIIGYGVSDLVLLYFVHTRCHYLAIRWPKRWPSRHLITDLLAIGIPASITNLTQSVSTALLNISLMAYGATSVAAMGIVQKIYLIVILVMVGLAFGAQPLLGYNFGAKNWPRLTAIIRFDLLIEVGCATGLAVGLMVGAPHLIHLFMTQPAIVTEGTQMLRLLLLTTPAIGAILVYTTLFQATGQALGAFVLSLSRQGVVFALCLVILVPLAGYWGILVTQPLADLCTLALGWGWYRHWQKHLKF